MDEASRVKADKVYREIDWPLFVVFARCMEERLLNAKRHPGQRRRAYRPGCRPPKSSLIGKLDAIRLERHS